MATLTAHALIGSSHVYHNGIAPTHYAFLSENSRAAWIMVSENLYKTAFPGKKALGLTGTERIVMIPTVEHMLEDLFLMVALYVARDEEVLGFMQEKLGKESPGRYLSLYDELTGEERKRLYMICRERSGRFPKITLSVFRRSTLRNQLSVVKEYKMEIEVCVCIYERKMDIWEKRMEENGDLTLPPRGSG